MLDRFPPALRRHGRRQVESGRRGVDRQDEHGRVRDGRLERKFGLLSHAKPVGSFADPRRFERRRGGLRGGAYGPAFVRHRHRRLDSLPGGPLRHLRLETDLRPSKPLRIGRVRQQSRSDRPDGENGRRRRVAAGSHRRTRSERFHFGRSAGAEIFGNRPPTAEKSPHRTGPRAFRRRARRRSRSGGPRGGASLSNRWERR